MVDKIGFGHVSCPCGMDHLGSLLPVYDIQYFLKQVQIFDGRFDMREMFSFIMEKRVELDQLFDLVNKIKSDGEFRPNEIKFIQDYCLSQFGAHLTWYQTHDLVISIASERITLKGLSVLMR